MRVFPDKFSARKENPVPGRPWWQSIALEISYRVVRSDGLIADNPEHAAVLDAESPLPRPPFGVGQVWALNAYDSWRVYTITGLMQFNGDKEVFNVSGPYMQPSISAGNLLEYLEHAFLLYDPIGQQAPWAPPAR